MRDADRVVGLLQRDEALDGIHLLINRFDDRRAERGELLSQEDIRDLLGVPLLTVVPEEKQVVSSSNRGEPLGLTSSAPAVQAIAQAAKFLVAEEVRKRAAAYRRKRIDASRQTFVRGQETYLCTMKLTADQKTLLQAKIQDYSLAGRAV